MPTYNISSVAALNNNGGVATSWPSANFTNAGFGSPSYASVSGYGSLLFPRESIARSAECVLPGPVQEGDTFTLYMDVELPTVTYAHDFEVSLELWTGTAWSTLIPRISTYQFANIDTQVTTNPIGAQYNGSTKARISIMGPMYPGSSVKLNFYAVTWRLDCSRVWTAPTITTSVLDELTEDDPCSQQLAATGDTPITWAVTAGSIPGVTLSSTGLLSGTPTTPGGYSITVSATNATGTDTETYTGTVSAASVADPAITTSVLDELTEDDPCSQQLAATGDTPITWAVTGTVSAASVADPAIETLAGRALIFLGRADELDEPDALQLAMEHVSIVLEYVRGYTRGRGFSGDAPAVPLRAVIVSASARLIANPSQVVSYRTGDYSETPAILAGWTIPERGVLHRFRKVSA
jgi:hypothetical protein